MRHGYTCAILAALVMTASSFAAPPVHAGGAVPGDVVIDIKCFKRSGTQYCGTYSKPGTINNDGKLHNLGSKESLLKQCTKNYPACCPEDDCRYEFKYCQKWKCWEEKHP